MTPVRIEGDARPLNPPPNWSEADHGRCGVLWIRREQVDGLPYMRSAWDVTAEEAGWLLAGAKVQLGIMGNSHPVVQLGLGPTPGDFIPPLTVEQIITPAGARSVRVMMFFGGGVRAYGNALLGDDGLGPAVALAIGEIEKIAKEAGLL